MVFLDDYTDALVTKMKLEGIYFQCLHKFILDLKNPNAMKLIWL